MISTSNTGSSTAPSSAPISTRLGPKGGLKIRPFLGRSRGGLSTKIHLAIRGLTVPVRLALTAGQRGDCPQAYSLIESLPAEVVMADAAYDAEPLREALAAKGAVAVIPTTVSAATRPVACWG